MVALTGCGKDSIFNPFQDVVIEQDIEIEKPELISNPHILLSECNCGEVLKWELNPNGVTIHTTAKNYCTGREKTFSSCPDETNPDVPEVGSEFCRDKIW